MENFINEIKNLSPGESFIYGGSKVKGNVSSDNKILKFKYEKTGNYTIYLLVDGVLEKIDTYTSDQFDAACESFIKYIGEQWNI